MEDPGGSEKTPNGGWAFRFERGPEGDKFKFDELLDADAQLLGRKTYEGFAAAWPSIKDEVGFAERMNSMPKYVVSTTLQQADWNNSTILPGNVLDEVTRLKQQPGRDILVAGSAQLVQTMARHQLVDEYRLMVFPVILGVGRRGKNSLPSSLPAHRRSRRARVWHRRLVSAFAGSRGGTRLDRQGNTCLLLWSE
jgi:dihydrofolate reductase